MKCEIAGNIQGNYLNFVLNRQKDVIPLSSTAMPNRLFSSEAREAANESAGFYFISPVFNGLRNLMFEGNLACNTVCCFRCRHSEGTI